MIPPVGACVPPVKGCLFVFGPVSLLFLRLRRIDGAEAPGLPRGAEQRRVVNLLPRAPF